MDNDGNIGVLHMAAHNNQQGGADHEDNLTK
jgi:hypothetical protein